MLIKPNSSKGRELNKNNTQERVNVKHGHVGSCDHVGCDRGVRTHARRPLKTGTTFTDRTITDREDQFMK